MRETIDQYHIIGFDQEKRQAMASIPATEAEMRRLDDGGSGTESGGVVEAAAVIDKLLETKNKTNKKKKLVRVSQQYINHLLANELKRVSFAADEDILGPFALFMDPKEVEEYRADSARAAVIFNDMYDTVEDILKQYRDKGYAMVPSRRRRQVTRFLICSYIYVHREQILNQCHFNVTQTEKFLAARVHACFKLIIH